MKRNYLKMLCALLIAGPVVTSCNDFDEVYLLTEVSGDEDLAEYQKTIKVWSDSIKHFKERTLTNLENSKECPDNVFAAYAPDVTETLADGTTVGYVDMGTSVYWAVMNVGDEMEPLLEIDSLIYYPEEPKLDYSGMAKSMPLLDYLNKKNTGSNQRLVDDYIKDCKEYMSNDRLKYRQLANYYYRKYIYMVSTDFHRFTWGTTELYKKDDVVDLSKIPAGDIQSSNDVAKRYWGSKWQTPTPEMFQELLDNCTYKMLTVTVRYLSGDNNMKTNTQYGALFTSKTTKKQLFFPTIAQDKKEYESYHACYMTTHRLDDESFQCFVVGKDRKVNIKAKIAESPAMVRPVRSK